MGHTLHVHKKHVIKYGASGFNRQIDGVKNLLKEAGCTVNGELNDDSVGEWEAEENEFREAVEKTACMDENKIASFFDKRYPDKDKKEFKNRIVKLLKTFAETGDTSDGYYHFSWF